MAKRGLATCVAVAAIALAAAPAAARCLDKAAEATAGSEKDAKWFVMETMVQAVSWGLWPAFVADGSTPGWKVTRQRYKCRSNGASVTCRGQATFCPTAKQ